jgi:hypothetical protein
MKRTCLCAVVTLLLLIPPTFVRRAAAQSGGIQKDAVSSSGVDATGNVSSITWSHTVGASAMNTALAVCVAASRRNGFGVAVTSVTCDGAPLNNAQYAGLSGCQTASIWYLTGVAPGCHQIVVTFALPLYTSTAKGYSISLSGVDQGNPLDGGAAEVGVGGSPGASFTTINDGATAIDISADEVSGGDLSPDAGQILMYDQAGGVSFADGSCVGISPPGATSTGWSALSGAAKWAYTVQSFAPAAAE